MNKQTQQYTKTNKHDKNSSQKEQNTLRILIDEKKSVEIIKKSKFITMYELSKHANVTLSTANRFLNKLIEKKLIKKIGGHSGHYVYVFEQE
ncbi:MAG: winged helix-turn-helix transcriptional regulator [Thaumarchaeota archaeon]|nr:winged helix-turn-helix transcriptional regulator [Nitrososphaerota archaeon]MCY3975567.1 winged helix-turn-helix transcriptional regulator [Nitrososphaerota archaeon]